MYLYSRAPHGPPGSHSLDVHQVSCLELQQASAEDPLFCALRSYITGGWPTRVPDELAPFARIKEELSCWNDTCVHSSVECSSGTSAGSGTRGTPGHRQIEAAMSGPCLVAWY
ncbi:UNVERIFIED_CONTAM: hypothetical protein FKN15_004818 [Acipenser sinensis]